MKIKEQKTSFFLAYKAILKGNIMTTIMTVAVIALAFVNLIFISALIAGISDKLNLQLINNETGNIRLSTEDEKYLTGVSKTRKIIESIPGVNATASHYLVSGSFKYDQNNDNKDISYRTFRVYGIDPNNEKNITEISKKMVAGEYLNSQDRQSIVIGKEVSGGYNASNENLSLEGADVGEEITITFPNGIIRDYKIKGIYAVDSMSADALTFITDTEMESILEVDNKASEIIIKIDDTGNEDIYINKIKNLGIAGKLETWVELSGGLATSLDSFRMVDRLIGGVGLMVAMITISIVTYINIVNKKKQIGIMRAIGIHKNIIVESYIIQAVFYSISGIIFGWIIIKFALEPFFIKHPLRFPMGEVSLMPENTELTQNAITLIIAAIIAALIPAWQTTKQTILESIWG